MFEIKDEVLLSCHIHKFPLQNWWKEFGMLQSSAHSSGPCQTLKLKTK